MDIVIHTCDPGTEKAKTGLGVSVQPARAAQYDSLSVQVVLDHLLEALGQ